MRGTALAEEFVNAVHEAATWRRDTIAKLVDEMRIAEDPADVERIKAEMEQVRHDYEDSLMAATVAMQGRNDLLHAELTALERQHLVV